MLKYRFFIAYALILSCTKIYSQDYSIVNIPDSIKENSNCVIRKYFKRIELHSINEGVEKIEKVITILRKEGEDNAELKIFYDKNSKVHIKQVTIYSKEGKRIRKVDLSEIKDFSAYNNSLYSDNRVKYFKPDYAEYPYTIEYFYEKKSTNIISYGCWIPIENLNISLQQAKLTIQYPENFVINKKEFAIELTSSYFENNNIIENWEVSNIKASEDEPYNNNFFESIPRVYLMPTLLYYNDHIGSAKNWAEYGKWVFDLFNGRDEISEIEKNKIILLIENLPDTLDRIKLLYKYLQSNTRYVSIQLGIGSFQPFSAKEVSLTGYGDCKALTNYMSSLLKLVGIKSFPALVASGRTIENIFKDFPNFNQFNHVILCVPYKSDTIWLECTNQNIPFGFLGYFTDDRDVLLITENGGQFGHTKKYDIFENSKICKASFIMDSLGVAIGNVKTTYEGLRYDDVFEFLSLSPSEQKIRLYEDSNLPIVQINNFTVNNFNFNWACAVIDESITSRNYGSFAGNYMLFPLNLLNSQEPIPKDLKGRNSDLVISRSYIDYDTLVYQIPKNYEINNLPEGFSISTKFGDYSYSNSFNQNSITYIRRFIIKQGIYKPEEYKDFYDFILTISKADHIKVMLRKKI